VSPVLFQEALQHVPDNAIVVEIAPHSLLQAVLRRALASTCNIVGLMDKRQPDNLVHLLTVFGKYVSLAMMFTVVISAEQTDQLWSSVNFVNAVLGVSEVIILLPYR